MSCIAETLEAFIAKHLQVVMNEHNVKNALILVGGPGSGKTTVIENTLEKLGVKKNEFEHIDQYIIKTTLFKNNNKCRKQANEINDVIYERAIAEKKNIIFDGIGKDFDWYSHAVLKRLTDIGYSVNLIIVTNKLDISIARTKAREKETGRHVDEKFVRDVHAILIDTIPHYISLGCNYVNTRMFVYDNSYDLRLVYQTHCDGSEKSIECIGAICDTAAKVIGAGNIKYRSIKRKKSTKGLKNIRTRKIKHMYF